MTGYTCPEGHNSSAGDYCDVCGSPISGSSGASSAPSAAPSPPPSDVAASSLDLDAPAPSATGTAGGTPDVPAGRVCPSCSVTGLPDALFCENCGYDFTTGQLPRPLDPPAGLDVPAPAADPDPDSDPGPGPAAAGVGSSQSGAVLQPPPTDPATPAPSPPPPDVEWVVEIWVDPDWHAAQDVEDPCPSPGMPTVVQLHDRSVLVGRTSASRNIHPDVEVVGDTGVSRRHAQLTTDGRRWFVEDLASANGTYVGQAGVPLPAQPIAVGLRSEIPEDGRIYLGAWTRLVIRKALPSEV